MDNPQNSIDKLLHDMRERAKELNCLYQVEELLTKTHLPLAEIFAQLIRTHAPQTLKGSEDPVSGQINRGGHAKYSSWHSGM
jgi:hypothetical protein